MPAPLDLAGRRFGALVVLREAESDLSGRERERRWLCRCDCGAEQVVYQRRLRTGARPLPRGHEVTACDACRAKACLVCGAPISASSAAATCGPECRAERDRQIGLAHYYAKRRDNPAQKAARAERASREWAALSPVDRREISRQRTASEGRERINERARESYARRMEDPDYAERRRELRAAWQEANRERTRLHSREYGRRRRTIKAARDLGEVAATIIRETDE